MPPLVRPRLLPRCSFPRHHRQRRPGGGLAGNGKRHHLLGLRHLKGRPGALQGHQPRAKAKQRPHAQREKARAARRRDGPSPPRGGAARKTQPGKGLAESVRCVRETNGREHRGRAGFRTPFPSPSTHRHRTGGGERRGAREQSEKSDPIRQGMSVPRLARLRPGPGERNVTTSIKHDKSTEKEKREDNRSKRAWCASSQASPT